MLSTLKSLTRLSPRQIYRRALFRLRGRVITVAPKGPSRGNVLLSYTTVPFTILSETQLSGHTNYWEARDMAAAFAERGYTVDVIDFSNSAFIPQKPYVYFSDIGENMQRLAPLLNADCIKVFHATGSYWRFQNDAEDSRLEAAHARRGAALKPRRHVAAYSIEHADVISSLCGLFPESTYAFLNKPIYRIPLSTTHTFPFPADKDFSLARKHFIWFGGAGAVHKGLDLVLEAFAAMPGFTLTVCGKFEGESDFVAAYHTELFDTPNIKTVGYIRPESELFAQIRKSAVGIIYPSCSEGCASSVVVAMHAGLIPIVSKETGVETCSFGITLTRNAADAISDALRALSAESTQQLEARSIGAWQYARAHHTREAFARTYRTFVDALEKRRSGVH